MALLMIDRTAVIKNWSFGGGINFISKICYITLISIFLLISTAYFSVSQSSSNPLGKSLEDYLKIAAENNPDLKASYTEFEVAMQQVSQVNALPDPVLSFGFFVSPIETKVGSQKAKISLTQMFPWFGTLKARETVATLMAEVRYQYFLNAKNKLYFNVKKVYYPIYEIKQHIYWQEENLSILKSYKQLSITSFSNGKGTMTDVLRVDILIDEVEVAIQLLRDKLIPYNLSFNRLLNRLDSVTVQIPDALFLVEISKNYRRDSLLVRNPILHALNLEMEVAQANELVVKKKGLPQFGIGIGYTVIDKVSNTNISSNGKNALMPMITMTLPVFRGKYRVSVAEIKLRQTAIGHRQKGLKNQLFAWYKSLWYEIEKAQQLTRLYNTQIKKNKQVLNLLHTAYSNSGNDFEEVLRIQQQQLKYEMAKATTVTAYFVALAEIDYITAKLY